MGHQGQTAHGTQQYHTPEQIQLGVVGAAFKDHPFHPIVEK